MIADTLWHEIAHYFGMDEPQVRSGGMAKAFSSRNAINAPVFGELTFGSSSPFRDSARGSRTGGVRIVRHHHDRLAEILVELRKHGQDVLRGGGVEVAGGLVGEDQGRVGDDGAGDGDALLLPAG